jgi:hypothetical protein
LPADLLAVEKRLAVPRIAQGHLDEEAACSSSGLTEAVGRSTESWPQMALPPQSRPFNNWCIMCPEEMRLQQAYDAALSAWKRNRLLADRIYSIDAKARLRRELLDARFKAANALYDHSIKCPDCKLSRLSSFDAVS